MEGIPSFLQDKGNPRDGEYFNKMESAREGCRPVVLGVCGGVDENMGQPTHTLQHRFKVIIYLLAHFDRGTATSLTISSRKRIVSMLRFAYLFTWFRTYFIVVL